MYHIKLLTGMRKSDYNYLFLLILWNTAAGAATEDF